MAVPPKRSALPRSLHPQVRALFESLPPFPAWSTLDPAEIRALPTLLAPAPEPVASVVQRGIRGQGGWLPIRIYRPPGEGLHPALLWMHGGGFMLGTLEGDDRKCRALTTRGSCIVVSVGYRLAPETKFPGALEDTYSALEWVAANAAELRVDPARIALGGESAGGNLAAAAALAARDRGGPTIALQLLIYPVTDMRLDTPSFSEFADGPIITRRDVAWFNEQYIARAEDADSPYLSVLRAPDLRRLPAALVVTAGCDPLRDQGEAYAVRLRDAGVEALTWRYDGMPHGFLGFQVALDDARRALDEIAAELKRRLGGPVVAPI
jgi:acetyl esterase